MIDVRSSEMRAISGLRNIMVESCALLDIRRICISPNNNFSGRPRDVFETVGLMAVTNNSSKPEHED